MIMTPQEQIDLLEMINNAKKISAQKTNLMEEIVLAASVVASENDLLRIENEQLRQQIAILEANQTAQSLENFKKI